MKKNKKKILVILLISIFVVSCGNTKEETKTESGRTSSGTEVETDESTQSEADTGMLDISDYIEKYEEFVGLLGLQKTEGSAVAEYTKGLDSYISDDFRLEYESGRIYSKNDGNENVCVFGVRVGDSISDTDKALKEQGFVECEEGGPDPVIVDNDYLKIVDNEPCYVELIVVDDKVTGWYFTNTENCQASIAEYYWDVFEAQREEFWQEVESKKYAPGVTIEGDERSNNELKISEHILLPRAEVLMIFSDFYTYDEFDESKQLATFEESVVEVPKEDIKKLIVAVENASIVSDEEMQTKEEQPEVGSDSTLNLVLLNNEGRIVSVYLTSRLGYSDITSIYWDDPDYSTEGKAGKELESSVLYEMIVKYGK